MSTTPSHERYLLGFSHVPGIGPMRLAALIGRFGDAAAAWQAPEHHLREVLDRRSATALVAARRAIDLDRSLDEVAAAGLRMVTQQHAAYPDRLRQIPNAPYLLYVRGDVELLGTRGVAVVGTRRATEYGRSATRVIATNLAAAGVTIVSGMALGIDGEAHRSALAAGGATVAVLGCGADVVYPPQHKKLMADIAERGAIVTEFPLGTPPDAGNFPARNRVVSGLSVATLVVEAGVKSGALITAGYALDQGRDVFAVPGSVFKQGCAGTNALLSAGAGVAISGEEILTALDLTHVVVQNEVRRSRPHDPTEAALLGHLGAEPIHIDELGLAAGLDSAIVARTLTLMELKGLARHTGGMQWMATL